ncbi:MAG: FAD-binding protein [Alistipes sp.]|nr:FAD-binding protein [Candidatus Alistipes equi]
MSHVVNITLSPKEAADENKQSQLVSKMLKIKESDIALIRIIKKSVDARHYPLKVNLSLEVYVDAEPLPEKITFEYPSVAYSKPVVIIGAGPAGLYAALRLIEFGLKPIIFERGKDIVERSKDIAQIHRNNSIDHNSNYAFGEGGAGTFSDGKLFTRSKKRGDYNRALQRLVFHGADEAILYEAHPHIGSDKLPRIIKSMREQIIRSGGEIHFSSRVTDIKTSNGHVSKIIANNTSIITDYVVLSTGHSARDVYQMLYEQKIALEAKAYAMGVRIEHPQELINKIQYHNSPDRDYLPAASYSLVEQINGRGVYSFCMCPGGFIVPALTSQEESVVNGMSPSHRGSPFANSGFVTEIREEDFAHLRKEYGILAGLELQKRLEYAARAEAPDHYKAPAQRVSDFVFGRVSSSLPASSFVPGLVESRLDKWMPQFIASRLREAIKVFDKRMHGYLTNEAIVVGVESRTSTPVRIPRNPETLEHIHIQGLYPAGEGAGYAGGIISAALDGERIAEAIFRKEEKRESLTPPIY